MAIIWKLKHTLAGVYLERAGDLGEKDSVILGAWHAFADDSDKRCIAAKA